MIPFAWPELISDCNAARRWEPPVLILSVGPAGKQACQVTDAPPAAGRLKLRVKLMKRDCMRCARGAVKPTVPSPIVMLLK